MINYGDSTEEKLDSKWFDKITIYNSSNPNVSKLIFTKHNAIAEAVLYKYESYSNRIVICCSTQSGCPIGCRFCGAGEAFIRSFTANEIVDQVNSCIKLVNLREDRDFSTLKTKRFQIMFMSMGEPALNQEELCNAIRELNKIYPNAALLISTSAPKVDFTPIFNIAKEIDKVGLQFSVHESTNEMRNKLIPFPNKYTLEQIASLGAQFYHSTNRHPFFNYCVHNANNTEEDADNLRWLFNRFYWEATLSVICERDETLQQTNEIQRKLATDFEKLLIERGFSTRTFDPAGQDDIAGGCGQLHQTQKYFKDHPEQTKRTCGTGKPIIHMPDYIGL